MQTNFYLQSVLQESLVQPLCNHDAAGFADSYDILEVLAKSCSSALSSPQSSELSAVLEDQSPYSAHPDLD